MPDIRLTFKNAKQMLISTRLSFGDPDQIRAMHCIQAVNQWKDVRDELRGLLGADEHCTECEGRGAVECDRCDGTGDCDHRGGECGECDGTGTVDCDACNADGCSTIDDSDPEGLTEQEALSLIQKYQPELALAGVAA